jgi:hypothetical protein
VTNKQQQENSLPSPFTPTVKARIVGLNLDKHPIAHQRVDDKGFGVGDLYRCLLSVVQAAGEYQRQPRK